MGRLNANQTPELALGVFKSLASDADGVSELRVRFPLFGCPLHDSRRIGIRNGAAQLGKAKGRPKSPLLLRQSRVATARALWPLRASNLYLAFRQISR